jgi:hypothetical protein
MLDIGKQPQVLLLATRFDVGPYVVISYNPQMMNAKPPTKLHPRLKGPYLVANVQGDKYSYCKISDNYMYAFPQNHRKGGCTNRLG